MDFASPSPNSLLGPRPVVRMQAGSELVSRPARSDTILMEYRCKRKNVGVGAEVEPGLVGSIDQVLIDEITQIVVD
ncbi:unnamed protein product [Clonostachys byssicola]|uniref:Uncharacterized protein n=1 Tax=Clonostachys byssicola TaxID=160290 RepID=A0A9N9UQK8_9HYPO|nr:unnamed protein product [Clonostachys byssicola]